MEYSELIFTCEGGENWQRDLLVQDLAELGFDSFEDSLSGFKAYIATATLDLVAIERLVLNLPAHFRVSYLVNQVQATNWNAVWESNFDPIIVGNQCYVRATFHEPKSVYPYEIIIDPKMSFGTGHHQTTSLMMAYLLEQDLTGKHVLDMGCGTGILAILASKLGAEAVTAIDFDPICCTSTKENSVLNQVNGITVLCGSKEVVPNELYDLVLANINRNVLLDQLPIYAAVLRPHGKLFLSGFYDGDDLKQLVDAGARFGLELREKREQDNWVAARFEKN